MGTSPRYIKAGDIGQEDGGVVGQSPVHRFSGVVADKERVVAEIIFEFFIRVRSDPQGPNMDHFRIEESLGVGFDKMNQGLHQILGLPAGGMDKDPVPPMDVAEDLFLGDEFLGIDLLDLITISILAFPRPSERLLIPSVYARAEVFESSTPENEPNPNLLFSFHFSIKPLKPSRGKAELGLRLDGIQG